MKKLIIALLIITAAFLPSCRQDSTIPPDFEFTLIWDVCGISSYDSAVGRLVKESAATVPEDYITTLILSGEQRENIRGILNDLDISKYPSKYDPCSGSLSTPSQTIILSVMYRGKTHTIECRGIAFEAKEEKGQAFFDACDAITSILVSTEEWKALPDYEHLYE